MIERGQIVDIGKQRIFKGEVTFENGIITSIIEKNHNVNQFIMPGFIDAHIHIESSMLVPSEFAKLAVAHGTIATISDPHEIANVMGLEGVNFMIENGKNTPFKFYFGAPSCVPATAYESSGASINSDAIKALLAKDDIKYLSEMMNYPGVLNKDKEVMQKLAWAKLFNKPVDGHAPGLRGESLTTYIQSGMSTDHECFSFEEGLEKLEKGMKILVREGSAAKNFEALISLLPRYYENMMFCSDDKHPDDLILGHINDLCSRAIKKGMDLFKVLQVACINPINHYNLDVGQLRVGDSADFLVVKDLHEFQTIRTYISGNKLFDNGTTFLNPVHFKVINNFNISDKEISDFSYKSNASKIKVIEAYNGELVTGTSIENSTIINGNLISNTEIDVLKIAVVNRYNDQKPAIGFIKNFGLKEGAIASSVGHDSHNIVVVGVTDEDLCKAVNMLVEYKGGICALSSVKQMILPLPIAGIMSDQEGRIVADKYAQIDAFSKELGSTLEAPFMTLSFMALLVIPSLKLSDKGLFDVQNFSFTSLKVQ
ncbi:adenine deaminase [Flavobacteriaceae bacterium]|nr:adenine deaminase [Flavobacteriaceae bacterium]MDC3242348.1 adenine deaminase [Flavobacteriaceae bacterium]